MTRWAVLLPLGFGVLVLLAIFVGKRLKAAAVVIERVEDEDFLAGMCRHGACAQECTECPRPAVVAGSDLDPLEALYRAAPFTGERSVRMPGEGR